MDLFGFKRRRRASILESRFPDDWRTIIDRNVRYFATLTADEQEQLLRDVQVFVAEKTFEGCAGLEVTDEMRVTISALACVLLLNRDTDLYPMLETILVYPHAYVAGGERRNPDGTVSIGGQGRLGESWMRGPVVLAWDEVLQGASDIRDGQNVVFHEFAHQLDNESGAPDGAPRLANRSSYVAWARVLGTEYENLLQDMEHHRRTLIDQYGATNPPEFFAVVSECFFEKPIQLRKKHPELYAELVEFYQQDPASRVGNQPQKKEKQPQVNTDKHR